MKRHKALNKVFLRGGFPISNQELFIQRLHELHRYVRTLGEHVFTIYKRLEQIEKDIDKMKNNQQLSIERNETALIVIKNIMATNSEVDALIQELITSITGFLPPLPDEQPMCQEQPQESQEQEQESQEQSQEPKKERRFPFLSRF